MNRKFLLLLVFALLFLQTPAKAFQTLGDPPYRSELSPLGRTYGYPYIMGGGIYNGVTVPFDTAKAPAFNTDSSKSLVPISNVTKDLGSSEKGLKTGTSSRANILQLVEIGDAGIDKAVKSAHITKIHYVEYKKEKVYIPLVFIPIYFDIYTTTVYGE